MAESRELSPYQCEALLRAGVAGRVAVSTMDGPHIVPVNYSVLDGAIVIATTPYSLLGTHGRDTTLAFEVDHLDTGRQRGWSVVARGRSSVIDDPAELERILTWWSPNPWAAGVRSLHLRLPWHELTGRQLGTDWDPLADLPREPTR